MQHLGVHASAGHFAAARPPHPPLHPSPDHNLRPEERDELAGNILRAFCGQPDLAAPPLWGDWYGSLPTIGYAASAPAR